MPLRNTMRASAIWMMMLLLLLAGNSWAATQPIKSPNDERAYRYFELPNGLQALVISDPSTDQAAASMNVSVGSGNDPSAYPGLAHFLEHMLFLGTEAYPDSGEYQAFIARHGGSHNAYTDFEDTNYYLEIDAPYLAPALDRFAQFFIAPLFTPDYVERERNAVHSEYQLKINDDGWRAMRALKEVINPAHPYANFSIGALETLPDEGDGKLRDALVAFYQDHYSADHMSIAVLGQASLDDLEKLVRERFSAVPRRDTVAAAKLPPLFEPDQLPLRLDVLPVKNLKQLKLTFPIPSPRDLYRSKPVFYLAGLVGHEGPGSLLSELKQRGWADGLSASGGRDLGDQSTFEIRIKLTGSGLDAVNDVVTHVFAYIDLLRESGTQRWMFDEQRQLMDIAFRFEEKRSPVGTVRSLSRRMSRDPIEDLLRAPYALEEYAPELIGEYLALLTPDNVLITVSAPGLETDRTERWMGAEYRVRSIAPETLRQWRDPGQVAALALPEPNGFIPQDLSLKRPDADNPVPQRVVDETGLRVWFKHDTQFNVPRATVRIAMRSPRASETPLDQVLNKLYLRMVEDQLTEYTYPALLAGLSYEISPSITGLVMDVGGYNDKLDRLLEQVLLALKTPDFDAKRFDIARTDLARQLQNVEQEDPYDRSLAEVPRLLIVPYWSKEEQLEALPAANLEALKAFVPDFLNKLEIEVLAHGNLDRADAVEIGDRLKTRLFAESELVELDDPVVLALSPGENAVRELRVPHTDSAVAVYSQGRQRGYQERARVGLLAQVISSPFYQELRTNQQLGYLVFASPMPFLEVPGMAFVVQSPVAGPLQLEDRIATFVQQYREELMAMSDEELERHKSGLISRILEQSRTLSDETERLWTDIRFSHYDFDSPDQLADAVRAIDKDQLVDAYDALLLSRDRRTLVVRAVPEQAMERITQSRADGGLEPVTDALAFKRGRVAITD